VLPMLLAKVLGNRALEKGATQCSHLGHEWNGTS